MRVKPASTCCVAARARARPAAAPTDGGPGSCPDPGRCSSTPAIQALALDPDRDQPRLKLGLPAVAHRCASPAGAAGGMPLVVMDIAGAQASWAYSAAVAASTSGWPRAEAQACWRRWRCRPAARNGGRRSRSGACRRPRAYRVNLGVLALVALRRRFLVYSVVALSVAQAPPAFALLGVLGMPARDRRRWCWPSRPCWHRSAACSASRWRTAGRRWHCAGCGDLGGGYLPAGAVYCACSASGRRPPTRALGSSPRRGWRLPARARRPVAGAGAQGTWRRRATPLPGLARWLALLACRCVRAQPATVGSRWRPVGGGGCVLAVHGLRAVAARCCARGIAPCAALLALLASGARASSATTATIAVAGGRQPGFVGGADGDGGELSRR